MLDEAKTDSKIERGSPQWVTGKLNETSERIFANAMRIFRHEVLFHALFLAFPIAGLLTLFLIREPIVDAIRGDVYLVGLFRAMSLVMWVALAASLFHLFRGQLKSWHILVLAAVTLVAKGFEYDRTRGFGLIVCEIVFYALTLGLLKFVAATARRHPERKDRPRFLIFGYLGLLLLWWTFGTFWGPEWAQFFRGRYTFFPERLLFPLLIFWAEWSNLIKDIPIFSKERVVHFLTPLNLIYGFPVERKYYDCAPDRVRIVRMQGLFDLTVTLFSAGLYYALLEGLFLPIVNSKNDALIWMTSGIVYYILLFLKSFWYFRMATGLGRWLGYDMRDAFDFALFAVSPMDRWRRWGIYFNVWLRDLVYFPVMARTGKLFLALAWTFFVSYFLHSFSLFTMIEIGTNASRLWSNTVYYALQLLVLYASAKVPGLWPTGGRRAGWGGVVLTMLLMAAVHTAVWMALGGSYS